MGVGIVIDCGGVVGELYCGFGFGESFGVDE